MRAARTLLERAAGVVGWKSTNCVAHLSAEARQLWGQLREDWMGVLLAGAVVLRLNLRMAPRPRFIGPASAATGPGAAEQGEGEDQRQQRQGERAEPIASRRNSNLSSNRTDTPDRRFRVILQKCLMILVLNRSSPSCQGRFRAGSLGCASHRPDGSGYQSPCCFSVAASCGFCRLLASGCCRWDCCCWRRTFHLCAACAAACLTGSSGDTPHGWQNEDATVRRRVPAAVAAGR